MTGRFRITLGQLNPTVGDMDGNKAAALKAWEKGKESGSDYVVMPEMFITGYQIQDMVMKPVFTKTAMQKIEELAVETADGPPLGIGGPYLNDEGLFNAYFVLEGGKIKTTVLKHFLPNDDVFDEKRLYDVGPINGPYQIGPVRIGTPICEDAWHPDVCEALMETGAEILIVPNGSPYYRHKSDVRMNHMVARTVETGLPLVYLNLVGGQDDQVFDGGSFALNPGGHMARSLPVFDEVIENIDFEETDKGWRVVLGTKADWPDALEQDYRVMVEALRDYMAKTGFKSVVLGLSGGVDSAIVATIAADALGPGDVHCVMLPSEYTSDESFNDAEMLAQNVDLHLQTISIAKARAAVSETLAPVFEGHEADLTEENIQSRLRGVLLMALSNKFGHMLLTTGNKSEVSVGYATIYGDMAGGYNPIKDMYKTRVFDVCRWRNENHRPWMMAPAGAIIPENIIVKPPTAELRPDQKDEDSLPPYDILDGILEMLVDDEASVADCVAAGYDRATVKKIEHLLYISEYKRFQSAPGARLSKRAFWLDRRYPIANRWRDPT